MASPNHTSLPFTPIAPSIQQRHTKADTLLASAFQPFQFESPQHNSYQFHSAIPYNTRSGIASPSLSPVIGPRQYLPQTRYTPLAPSQQQQAQYSQDQQLLHYQKTAQNLQHPQQYYQPQQYHQPQYFPHQYQGTPQRQSPRQLESRQPSGEDNHGDQSYQISPLPQTSLPQPSSSESSSSKRKHSELKEEEDLENSKDLRKRFWTNAPSLTLVDWISDYDNYKRLNAVRPTQGHRPIDVRKQIAAHINSLHPEANWTEETVKSKLQHLKKQYQKAKSLVSKAGEGNMHDNPTLKARVLNICPAFEKLDSVYSASLSVNPPRPIQSTNFANPGISDSDGNDGNETETSIIDIEDDENESTTDVVKTLNTGKIVKRSRKASEHINAEIMLQLLQETRKKQENDVKWTSDRRHLVTNRENAVCHREHVMFSRESELQELYRDKMTKIEITEESLRRRLDERDAQIELLKQKRDEEVDQLKQAKDEELKQLRQEKDAELNRLKQENDAEMKRLRQEKDEELKRLRQEKDEELEKLKQEIKSVKEDHEREKQKLRDERDEERKDRVVLEKQLIPVMCEKAALQKELETLKTVRLQK